MNNCDELLGDCYSDGKTDYSRDDDGVVITITTLILITNDEILKKEMYIISNIFKF